MWLKCLLAFSPIQLSQKQQKMGTEQWKPRNGYKRRLESWCLEVGSSISGGGRLCQGVSPQWEPSRILAKPLGSQDQAGILRSVLRFHPSCRCPGLRAQLAVPHCWRFCSADFMGMFPPLKAQSFMILKEIWLQPQQALARYSLKAFLIRKRHLKCALV